MAGQNFHQVTGRPGIQTHPRAGGRDGPGHTPPTFPLPSHPERTPNRTSPSPGAPSSLLNPLPWGLTPNAGLLRSDFPTASTVVSGALSSQPGSGTPAPQSLRSPGDPARQQRRGPGSSARRSAPQIHMVSRWRGTLKSGTRRTAWPGLGVGVSLVAKPAPSGLQAPPRRAKTRPPGVTHPPPDFDSVVLGPHQATLRVTREDPTGSVSSSLHTYSGPRNLGLRV